MNIKITKKVAEQIIRNFGALKANVYTFTLNARVDQSTQITYMQVQGVTEKAQLIELLPYSDISAEKSASADVIFFDDNIIKTLNAIVGYTEEDITLDIQDTKCVISTVSKKVKLEIPRLPSQEISGYRPTADTILSVKFVSEKFLDMLSNAAYLEDVTSEMLRNFCLSFRTKANKMFCYSTDRHSVAKDSMTCEYQDTPESEKKREEVLDATSSVDDFRISIPLANLGVIRAFLEGTSSIILKMCDKSHINLRSGNGVLTITLSPKNLAIYKQTADAWADIAPINNTLVDSAQVDKALSIITLQQKESKPVLLKFGKSLELNYAEAKVKVQVIGQKGDNETFLVSPTLLKSALRKKGNACFRIILTTIGNKETTVLAVGSAGLEEDFTSVCYMLPVVGNTTKEGNSEQNDDEEE